MRTKHIEKIIGENVRALRIAQGMKQSEMKTVSPRAMSSLENGAGFSVQTMLRALLELSALSMLGDIAVEKVNSPMELLKTGGKARQRVRGKGRAGNQSW